MGFCEFLGAADFSALPDDITWFDMILASGIFGLAVLLLCLVLLGLGILGLLSRPRPRLSIALGCLGFVLGIVGAYFGYNVADSYILQRGGWAKVDPVELADAAAFTMVLVYLGLAALALGLLSALTRVLRGSGERGEAAAA